VDVAATAPPLTERAPWRASTKLAFRFCFVYGSLYVLLTQMLNSIVRLPIPELQTLWPARQLVMWTARHVFHIQQPLVIFSGSGDKTFDWVEVFCLLVVAAVATLVWSVVDRRRPDYRRLFRWFHLLARVALAATLLEYGMMKAIPLQMPAPFLTRLIEPFGNFSPMGVLWLSIGASRPYEIFTGCAELLAGILLLLPGASLLGALVALADTAQVFALNMTYDVPVKLLSFQLVLLSLFILAPDAKRLWDFLVLNRSAGSSTSWPPGEGRRSKRVVIAAQLVLCAYLLLMNVQRSVQGWYQYGGGAPLPPYYGIWNVDEMIRDAETRPPLLTDANRWRRVVIQRANSVALQRMNDSVATYRAVLSGYSLSLYEGDNKTATFTIERPATDRLTLDGTMDRHRVRMQLSLLDRKNFLLVSRGFNWVQEYPFNR
jgi:uncharacterized membrane protein YphA (DoxX/SURF4 family)